MAKTTEKNVATKEGGRDVAVARPASVLSAYDEMERAFDRLFSRGLLSPLNWRVPFFEERPTAMETRVPKVDVVDRDEDVLIRAEVPGLDKKDIDISMTEDLVTIKGTTHHESREEKGDYYRCEISQGAFSRSISLPNLVDSDNAKATVKDGILEITAPKQKKTKHRTVEIS